MHVVNAPSNSVCLVSLCSKAQQTSSQPQPAHLPGEDESRREEELRPVFTYAADAICPHVGPTRFPCFHLFVPLLQTTERTTSRPKTRQSVRCKFPLQSPLLAAMLLLVLTVTCVFQLGVGAAEQQGGSSEHGLQRRPERRGEQPRAGADQGHRRGGEEDEWERQLLRLRCSK